jgi:hypothetical protein
VIVNTVNMPKMHPKLFAAGLKMLKPTEVQVYGETTYFRLDGCGYSLTRGVLSSREAGQAQIEKMAGRLKVAYSHQVVRATAAKHGWGLKSVGASKYMMIKR